MSANKRTVQPKSRIRFTEKELDALIALTCIAEASAEGQGDYAGFDYKAMESAVPKLATLRRRMRDEKR